MGLLNPGLISNQFCSSIQSLYATMLLRVNQASPEALFTPAGIDISGQPPRFQAPEGQASGWNISAPITSQSRAGYSKSS
jgi:hypothetical protein